MTSTTWGGSISSVCANIGLMGGRQHKERCSHWSGQAAPVEKADARVVWAQSDHTAFARSFMPAVRLHSRGGDTGARPRFYLFTGNRSSTLHFENGRLLRLAPDELVLLKMGAPLDWTIDQAYAASSLIVEESMLQDLCPTYDLLVSRRLHFPLGLERPMHDLMSSAGAALEAGSFDAAGDGLAFAIMRLLGFAKSLEDDQVDADLAPALERRYEQIKAFIERHFADPELSIGSIARHFGVSPRYVQLAMANVDTTPSDFIRLTRLHAAAKMLLATDSKRKSITDIAFDCGFNSSSYFSTEFKKFSTFSPKVYRNYFEHSDKESVKLHALMN